jgi:stearoyl-CoA desaturase (delta-9 desaturase)
MISLNRPSKLMRYWSKVVSFSASRRWPMAMGRSSRRLSGAANAWSSDTDADDHSPSRGLRHAHIGWLWEKEVDDIDLRLIPGLLRPIPLWVERRQGVLHLMYASSVALIFGWPALLSSWIVPIVFCWHTTFATNSSCHRFGSHPFSSRPSGSCFARNNAMVALLNLGEGWNNNHHGLCHIGKSST